MGLGNNLSSMMMAAAGDVEIVAIPVLEALPDRHDELS
jgi:hypothetical protein